VTPGSLAPPCRECTHPVGDRCLAGRALLAGCRGGARTAVRFVVPECCARTRARREARPS